MEALEEPEPDSGRRVYNLLGLWLSTLLYGVYFCLFIKSFSGQSRGWKRVNSRVFFVGRCVMFVIATLHAIIGAYTLVHDFAPNTVQRAERPLKILQNSSRWDLFTSYATVNFVIWIADMLVIYRCYIVWEKNWKVIVVPCLLLGASISKNIVSLHWTLHPELTYLTGPVMVFFNLCFPINLAQNVITTGLIVYKILRQHFLSASSGVSSSSAISLLGVVRIIVESAFLYTVQLLLVIILYQIPHDSYLILQSALVPSASLIFVLMSVRIEAAKAQFERTARDSESLVLPGWLQVSVSRPSTGARSDESVVVEGKKSSNDAV